MEFTKPKYKNLITYLHSRNHYKDVDKFTDDNKDDILSNFILISNRKCDEGKCFCGKKIKNVFYVYCILNNELIESGGKCKSLFNNKKETKEKFNNNFIRKFRNGLGFEPILNWDGYIEKVLREFLITNTLEELEELKLLYKDYHRTSSVINEYYEEERISEDEREWREMRRQYEKERDRKREIEKERERELEIEKAREEEKRWRREQKRREKRGKELEIERFKERYRLEMKERFKEQFRECNSAS
jgi:flagellar biosynthesis GTPase FlhF